MKSTLKKTSADKGEANKSTEVERYCRQYFQIAKTIEDELKDIYWGWKKAMFKAIPKMAKKASSSKLADALNEHSQKRKNM